MADGYTLKELVQELRNDNKQFLTTQTSILSSLESIDKHLQQLNSKVASHEKRFVTLESFQTKVMTVWGIAIFFVVTAINKFI
jgi:hypothetical protein